MSSELKIPQTLTNEQAVIAAILDDGDSFAEAADFLTLSDFSTKEFAKCWEWMTELFAASRPITLFSLSQSFSQTPQWKEVQSAISSAPAAAGHARHAASVLADRAALRRAVAALMTATETAAACNTFHEARPQLEGLLMGVFADSGRRDMIHISEAVENIKYQIAHPSVAPKQFQTGFETLDKMTKGGPREKHLMILAGKSGEGKTTMAINIITNIAANGIKCGVFSLEMDAEELTRRAIWSLSRRFPDFNLVCDKVAALDIHISDTPDRTVESVRAAIKLMVMRHQVKVIALDYLQLLGTIPGKDNRERQVANMSRALKIAAKESGVFIIALSQLNEEGQLRESRAIEQDADEVLYVIKSSGDHYLWLTKNRHGAKHGNVAEMVEKVEDEGIPLFFDAENFRFEEKLNV